MPFLQQTHTAEGMSHILKRAAPPITPLKTETKGTIWYKNSKGAVSRSFSRFPPRILHQAGLLKVASQLLA